MKAQPAWLLAVVLGIAVTGVVVLDALGRDDGAQRVVGMTVPILTALFVVGRLDARSNAQDATLEAQAAKLEAHTETLDQVAHDVNGNLTRRLEAATAPIRAELAALRDEQSRVAANLTANSSTATVAVTATVVEPEG